MKSQPASRAESFRPVSIESLQPFRLLTAPVYLFLQRNSKFVSLKAALDFFTPDELEKLKAKETVFLPDFVDRLEPFRSAARRVRSVLSWQVPSRQGTLEPAPYEISDAVLRVLASLWAPIDDRPDSPLGVEPYFAFVLGEEMSEPLPPEWVSAVRDESVEAFELAVLRANLGVFLALHLGFLDPALLDEYRRAAYCRSARWSAGPAPSLPPELEELEAWVREHTDGEGAVVISTELFAGSDRVSSKLRSRLARAARDKLGGDGVAPTAWGEDGILEAEGGGA